MTHRRVLLISLVLFLSTLTIAATDCLLTIYLHGDASQADCRTAGYWHFVIPRIPSGMTPPASIIVTLTTPSTVTVKLNRDKFVGSSAHYSTTQYLAGTVISASTQIDLNYTGPGINLSCPQSTGVRLSSFTATADNSSLLSSLLNTLLRLSRLF